MAMAETGTGSSVPLSTFHALLSEYLMGGYRDDELVIGEVSIGEDGIFARCSMQSYFIPSNGVFHLTVPLVFLAVAQLAIIYAHVDNGLKRKESEVFVHDISLKCREQVTKTSLIGIELTLKTKRELEKGIYYRGAISVENNAFVGEGAFLLPVKRRRLYE
jgi:hypothetical protein